MFFKKLIFPDFRSIEPIARPIEITKKNLVWICLVRLLLDWCWINQICFSIDWPIFRPIENQSESFLKHELFTCSSLFQKAILSLFDQSKFTINFLSFSLKFFSRFLSSSTSKTILPFLFLFNLICHAFFHTGTFSNLIIFGVFDVWDDFFQNSSMGFCY